MGVERAGIDLTIPLGVLVFVKSQLSIHLWQRQLYFISFTVDIETCVHTLLMSERPRVIPESIKEQIVFSLLLRDLLDCLQIFLRYRASDIVVIVFHFDIDQLISLLICGEDLLLETSEDQE